MIEDVEIASTRGREVALRRVVVFAPGIQLDRQLFSLVRLSEKKPRRRPAVN